jgi:PKD repeat protein
VQFHGTCSDPDSPCAAFAWDFGDGAVDTFTSSGGGSATSTSPSYTFTGSRTYTVSFTAEDAHGGARSVLSSVSTVNSPPSASIQASPGVGSAPLTVRFTGTASDADGTVISYAWNFGDGSSATVQNPSHTFTKQGTYNVSFTVTDERGAFTTATTTIIVQ